MADHRQVQAMGDAFAAHERQHHNIADPEPIPQDCLSDVLDRYDLILAVPDDIPPSTNPGGLVARVYGRDGGLVLQGMVGPDPVATGLQAQAHIQDVLSSPRFGDGVVLVIYDGDTGHRFDPREA